MNIKNLFGVLILLFTFGSHSIAQISLEKEARDLYAYSFGGLENMEVDDAVEMLDRLGYAGIAAEGRGESALARFDQYYEWSERKGGEFEVASAFMAHRFDQYGFSQAAHKAAIDRLSGKEGYLWLWVRDADQDGSITEEMVETFIREILDYAVSKGVKVVLYPHYNTWYPTTEKALALVEKIDNPSLGIAINLCHELMSDNGGNLEQTFEMAKDRLFTVIISGSLIDLNRTSVSTMNASTIRSLDDSPYDLRLYMRLIKKSGFDGPIGFINFKLSNPEDYLERTMTRWKELCEEVGLYEFGDPKSYLDNCDALTDWESSTELRLNSTDKQQGTASIEFAGSSTEEYKKVFSTPFKATGSAASAVLKFSYYVSDASLMGANNQVELGSAGVADQDEYSWTLAGLSTGWNFISLKISDADVVGTPDINAINWFRLYNEKSGTVTTRIDLIQIEEMNTEYNLVVDNGTGEGEYIEGKIVSITANEAQQDMAFVSWVVDAGNPEIIDVNAISTLLIMSAGDAKISATYTDVAYELSVNEGTGSGNYLVGEVVNIMADAAPEGMIFDYWIVDTGSPEIANVNEESTTLTIPSGGATITASYKIIEIVTGIAKGAFEAQSIKIYPNPIKGDILNIELEAFDATSNLEVEIRNLQGQIVYSNSGLNGNHIVIDTHGLPHKSCYLVTIKSKHSVITSKVFLQ